MTADRSISHDPQDVERVWKLMDDIKICMLASSEGDALRIRPMGAQPRQSENAIYFLTDVSGHKDEEIEADDRVCLGFAKPNDGKYLSISGRARVLNDRALIKDLWSPAAQAWWSGPDDPSIRAIEVTPEDAQYWEGPGGVAAMIKMAAAAVTGQRPDMGEQRKVELN
jgi:general stress protein 26